MSAVVSFAFVRAKVFHQFRFQSGYIDSFEDLNQHKS